MDAGRRIEGRPLCSNGDPGAPGAEFRRDLKRHQDALAGLARDEPGAIDAMRALSAEFASPQSTRLALLLLAIDFDARNGRLAEADRGICEWLRARARPPPQRRAHTALAAGRGAETGRWRLDRGDWNTGVFIRTSEDDRCEARVALVSRNE